jgi:hypothetical protein
MTTSSLMLKAEEFVIEASESIGFSIIGTIVQQDHTKNVVLVKEGGSGKVQAYRAGHAILEKYRIVAIDNQFIVVLKDRQKTKVFQDKFAGAAVASSSGNLNTKGFAEN